MHSRPFMKYQGQFTILLDSMSIDEKIPDLSRRVKALFKYTEEKFLNFIRTPETVSSTIL